VLVSLICATVDRTEELEALIRSLDAQRFAAFELIVVDQNADERVAALLARVKPGFRLTHLRTPQRGANAARNMGARSAAGAWLGFPDDDCVYHADTLVRLHEALTARPAVAVAGRVLCEDGRPIVPIPAVGRVVRGGQAFRFGTESILFVEAAAFHRCGGFDERFGPGAAYPATEGAELLLRLMRAARGPVRFEPTVTCAHPRKDGPVAPWLLARTRAYAFGTGATACRHARLGTFAWFVAKALVAWCVVDRRRAPIYAERARGLCEGFGAYARATGLGR
jgi:glycosyltransferase involved in cell wall biosynthesis